MRGAMGAGALTRGSIAERVLVVKRLEVARRMKMRWPKARREPARELNGVYGDTSHGGRDGCRRADESLG